MRLPDYTTRGAGWFAAWVAEQAEARLPPGQDAELRTTLDSRLETEAQTALDALLAREGEKWGVSEGAIVIIDAETGAVRAMVGGRGDGGGFNRAVLARRQPGSAFKPVIWLNALEHGESPQSLVLDAPIRLGGWAPQDIEHRYLGPITLTEALARSSNTASVRLLLRDRPPPRHRGRASRRCHARPRHRLGEPPLPHPRLCPLLQWRAPDQRRIRGRAPCHRRPGDLPRRGRGDAHDAARGGRGGNGDRSTGAGPRCRRQDRHLAGLPGCLVHRRGGAHPDRHLARQ